MLKLTGKTLRPELSPEARLLFCCARTHLDPANAGRIKSLVEEDIDWSYLIRTACWHRVMPLLYWNLNATCPEAIPQPFRDQLQNHFYTNAEHNLLLTGELLKLLRLLERHAVPVIPYKGPLLATLVYGNLALRQFQDLDILVHPRDILRAKELFIAQGYRTNYLLSPTQEATYLQASCEYNFQREDGRIHLEMHWQILPRYLCFQLDHNRLWESLESVSLAGTVALNLPPEDLLLILCVHGGSKHRWDRLGWLCDVAELIRVYNELNWERVLQQARTLGSERMLFLGLFLTQELLGAALPEEVGVKVGGDAAIKMLARQVYERLFREIDGQPGFLEKTLFHLGLRERWQDKARYIWYSLTPNAKDLTYLALPDFLYFLYYLFRPIRLVSEYVLSPSKWRLGSRN